MVDFESNLPIFGLRIGAQTREPTQFIFSGKRPRPRRQRISDNLKYQNLIINFSKFQDLYLFYDLIMTCFLRIFFFQLRKSLCYHFDPFFFVALLRLENICGHHLITVQRQSLICRLQPLVFKQKLICYQKRQILTLKISSVLNSNIFPDVKIIYEIFQNLTLY